MDDSFIDQYSCLEYQNGAFSPYLLGYLVGSDFCCCLNCLSFFGKSFLLCPLATLYLEGSTFCSCILSKISNTTPEVPFALLDNQLLTS
jgi:hypothetical protein